MSDVGQAKRVATVPSSVQRENRFNLQIEMVLLNALLTE